MGDGRGWILYEYLCDAGFLPGARGVALDSMPVGHQLILALGSVRTEVASGGFDFYLRHTYGDLAIHAVRAARQANCPDVAAVIQAALQRIGADPYPPDALTREEIIDSSRLTFDDLDEAFYDLETKVDLNAAMDSLVDLEP
jgi:hypothetical protein